MARAVREPYDEGKEWLDNSRAGAAASANIAPIHQATVTLDNDQIKALPGGLALEGVTEIIAAQGANKLILPAEICTLTSFAAAGYTNIGVDSQMTFVIGSSISAYTLVSSILRDNGGTSANFSTFFGVGPGETPRFVGWPKNLNVEESDAAAGNWFNLIPVGGTLTDSANKPLQIYCFNSTGDLTGGNAANTLIVSVAYYVLNTVTGEFE